MFWGLVCLEVYQGLRIPGKELLGGFPIALQPPFGRDLFYDVMREDSVKRLQWVKTCVTMPGGAFCASLIFCLITQEENDS